MQPVSRLPVQEVSYLVPDIRNIRAYMCITLCLKKTVLLEAILNLVSRECPRGALYTSKKISSLTSGKLITSL